MLAAPDPLFSQRDLVAYYCMEFGLDERLPLYAGGLGVLAGDLLKAARDQGRAMVGVGIFWGEGYTHQVLDDLGQPTDAWLPTPRQALRPTGVEVLVRIHGKDVRVTAWRVDAYDNVPLFLLEPIDPWNRWISKRLYGGGSDERVAQEILLGIGGARVLRELGLDVAVHHFNEGHPVFAGVELLRVRMEAGLSFDAALAEVRDRVAFTTHTPVPAGNECHPLDQLETMGVTGGPIDRAVLQRLGGDPFEMTPAALRICGAANAVAELHGATAQKMWAHVHGAPIFPITNGVHLATWQDEELAHLVHAEGSDEALWARHQTLKHGLLDEIARRNGVRLRDDVLLIGFARRATAYKRATLILRDVAWLSDLLQAGRLQLVFSGKAHPADLAGHAMVQEIAAYARKRPEGIVWLDDYDMALGRMLTRGCDVWLNTPRRPMEASGTSGMKSAANGGLNVSVLDGWWDEACEHGVNGWQFGDRREAHHDGDDLRDLAALQEVMSREVLPRYEGDRAGWIRMMRAAVRMASTRFSSDRMLHAYEAQLYGPLRARAAGEGDPA